MQSPVARRDVPGLLGLQSSGAAHACREIRELAEDVLALGARPSEYVDIRELLRPLRSRWWLILAVVVAATAGTYLYYASKPKRYTVSAELLIRTSEADAGFSSGNASRTAKDLARLLKSSPVVEKVQRDVGVSGQVSASASTDSDFVTVTATAGSPNDAARLANAYADALVAGRRGQLRKDTEEALITARRDLALLPAGRGKADSRSALRSRINNLEAALTVPGAGAERVGQARPPSGSSAPRPERNAAFAFLLSLMLGVAAAYALAWLDRRIRHVEDVERVYGLNLIGVVPHAAPVNERGGRYPTADQFFREAFRTLLTNIQCTSDDRPPRTVLVTSALPAEGKSTVVRNLALASRDSGLRVAVVESDLHAPSLATMFRVQTAPGLINVLSGGVDLGDALQRVTADTPASTEVESATVTAAANGDSAAVSDGSISVLTSGSVTANPPALLATERVTSLFDQIAAEYDLTLIDSSPLLTVSDSVPLLSLADATILVCRVGLATVPAVRRVTEILQRHPRANILGVVANDVPTEEFERRYADYYGSVTTVPATDPSWTRR